MNTPQTETPTQAWSRRTAQAGEVDFTMMYVAHDAFNRDLARLLAAARAGRGSRRRHWPPGSSSVASCTPITPPRTPRCGRGCALRSRWRRAGPARRDGGRARGARPAARSDRGGTGRPARRPTRDRAQGPRRTGWPPTCVHEEDAALPLVERRIGAAGWDAFGKEIRDQNGGIKGGALYLPWVLDGATDDDEEPSAQAPPATGSAPVPRLGAQVPQRRTTGRMTARTTGRIRTAH